MTGLSASSVAARIGKTAFLEPETLTCPDNGTPPLIINLFINKRIYTDVIERPVF
jgi:hypothetical protein